MGKESGFVCECYKNFIENKLNLSTEYVKIYGVENSVTDMKVAESLQVLER